MVYGNFFQHSKPKLNDFPLFNELPVEVKACVFDFLTLK